MRGDLTVWLSQAILGDRAAWDELRALDPAVVVERAESHGVLPLLAEQARNTANTSHPLTEILRARATTAVARDLVAVAALTDVVDAFQRAGVSALLLKGVDLGLSIYARSDLRPRLDSDLLVPVSACGAAREVLTQLGYVALSHVGGDLLMYQQSFVLSRHGVTMHTVDLHWRVANPQRFGRVLPFEELAAVAEARPRLSEAARGLAPVHALLLACVHRVAHHFDDPRLIWIHDVLLLTSRMSPADWTVFVALASERQVAVPCARGLALATATFGADVPADVMQALDARRGQERGEDAFLSAGHRHIHRVMSDLAQLPSWTSRVRLARQHVFPSPRYMRDVYAPASHAPLVLLYARRVWRGARRWMERS